MNKTQILKIAAYMRLFSEKLNTYHRESKLRLPIEFQALTILNTLNFKIYSFTSKLSLGSSDDVNRIVAHDFPPFVVAAIALEGLNYREENNYPLIVFQQALFKLYISCESLLSKDNCYAANKILKELDYTIRYLDADLEEIESTDDELYESNVPKPR